MHDDAAEMTQQFHASLKEALEQGAEQLEAQRQINARLDSLIGMLIEVLATSDAVQIEDVPEAIQ